MITRALYGTEKQYVDVIEYFKNDQTNFIVSNELFNCDPHIGRHKHLRLDYMIDDKLYNYRYDEREMIDITNLNTNNCDNNDHKIYDCFTFYNEIDLLEIRLNEMYDIVEKFIIIEADKTHTGNAKESFYLNNINRFEKFSNKIIHKIINLPKLSPWDCEQYQRQYIYDILIELTPSADDIIIISDADEIPHAKSIITNIPYIIRKKICIYYTNQI